MSEDIFGGLASDQAGARLLELGWAHVGTSNWSDVYADPDGTRAIRIAPFDPAHRLFIEIVGAMPENPWLPRRVARHPLADGGLAVEMERLWPAGNHRADALVAAIALPNDVGTRLPDPGPEIATNEPGIVSLRATLRKVQTSGREKYRIWGGSSLTRAKVMADGEGNLKLTNPAFISGPRLIDAIEHGNENVLGDFTQDELLRFPKIPYFRRDIDRRELARQLTRIIEARGTDA